MFQRLPPLGISPLNPMLVPAPIIFDATQKPF